MSEASEAKASKWVDEVIYDADKLEILDARKCAEGDKSGSYWSTIIGFNLRDIEGAMSLAEVNTGEDEATDKALCEAIVEGLKLRAQHAAHLARCARMEAALRAAREFLPAISSLPTKTRTRVGDVTRMVDEALSSAPVAKGAPK